MPPVKYSGAMYEGVPETSSSRSAPAWSPRGDTAGAGLPVNVAEVKHGEAKVVIVPKLFRGFDHETMARTLQPRLPKLQHIIVVDGEGTNSFDQALLSGSDRLGPPPVGEIGALVALGDDLLLENMHLFHHQQAHIAHDVAR